MWFNILLHFEWFSAFEFLQNRILIVKLKNLTFIIIASFCCVDKHTKNIHRRSSILRNLIFAKYVYVRFHTLGICKSEVLLHLIFEINIYLWSCFEFESCVLFSNIYSFWKRKLRLTSSKHIRYWKVLVQYLLQVDRQLFLLFVIYVCDYVSFFQSLLRCILFRKN